MTVKVRREKSADRINAVVNHPSVLPHVCGALEGPLDLSAAVADRNNYLLMAEHGGIMFAHHQLGLFEAHTQVLPEGRGRWALDMALASLQWIFTRTLAMEVVTRVARGNYAALALARAVGGTKVVDLPGGWETREGKVDATVLSITFHDWLAKGRHGLAERGAWVRRKWPDTPVSDDTALGMMFEMMSHGQVAKSAILLARWFAITGQDIKVDVLSDKKARLMIGDTIVVAIDDTDLMVIPA